MHLIRCIAPRRKVWIGQVNVATRAEPERRATRLWVALADSTLRVPPVGRHSLAGAAEAHARLERRATSGALVLLA